MGGRARLEGVDCNGAAMATYPYRCRDHGTVDVHRPIGTAPTSVLCPTCGSDSARVFSAPMLARTSPGIAAAHQMEEKSRDAPDVVGSLPARRSRQPTAMNPAVMNPALRGLPRP